MTLLIKKYFPLFLFVAFVITGIQTATAATYYVIPNGSASWNNCTSINTPCSPVVSMANAYPVTGTRGILMEESAHNFFGNSSAYNYLVLIRLYQTDQAMYTTLSAWQNTGELMEGGNPGVGSLASDSKFINSSGNMNQLTDFVLAQDSPSKGTGGIVRPMPSALQIN